MPEEQPTPKSPTPEELAQMPHSHNEPPGSDISSPPPVDETAPPVEPPPERRAQHTPASPSRGAPRPMPGRR